MRRHEDNKGSDREQAGFTLIELMVVVLIIGILIAIALPVYEGARQRAEDRAAEEDVRTGLVAALTYFSETGNYSTFGVPQAQQAEATLKWVAPGPPAQGQIAIQVALGQDLLLIGLSDSGKFVCLAQQSGSPLTSTGKDSVFANIDTVPECTGGW